MSTRHLLPEGRRGNLKGEEEKEESERRKKFFRIVKAGFSAKRKTLVNNLSNGLHIDKKEIEEKLESLGFLKNVRAQELGVEDWKKLEASTDASRKYGRERE